MPEKTRIELDLRCMVQREDGFFVAHCIDLNLAAQSETLEGAKAKLHSMIDDHLSMVAGLVEQGDLQSARQLLERKSPISIRARYQFANTFGKVRAAAMAAGKAWRERHDSPLPA